MEGQWPGIGIGFGRRQSLEIMLYKFELTSIDVYIWSMASAM